MPKKLITIAGPTSSGKTSLAIDMCKRLNGVIISADSRQIYKYMDIGTGKIPVGKEIDIKKYENKWTLSGIDLYGYDLVTPEITYSAFDYVVFARNKIAELQLQKDIEYIFLVGGTGFYIDAVLGNIKLEGGNPDYILRKKLENEPLDLLDRKLKELNLNAYEKIDTKNKVRLIRAIERELNTTHKKDLPTLKITPTSYIGLRGTRETLYKKTDSWLDSIWLNGLNEEVKELIDMGYEQSPKLHGIVYKSSYAYITGKMNQEQAKERAKFDLHAYIRRQETWFKNKNNIHWLDIDKDVTSDALNLLK